MIYPQEIQTRLAEWQRTLPTEIEIPGRERPVTRTALVAVLREELMPFITHGPTRSQAITSDVLRALAWYRNGRGDRFIEALTFALDAASGHRSHKAEPFDPNASHVTATTWSTSYSTGSHIEGAVLNVHGFDATAPNPWGGVGVTYRHPVYDGRTFPSMEAATEFAYKAGLLKRFVPRLALVQA